MNCGKNNTRDKGKSSIEKKQMTNIIDSNKGYVTVETSLIVPVVLSVIMLGIGLMLDCIWDAAVVGTAYTDLYAFHKNMSEKDMEEEVQRNLLDCFPYSGIETEAQSTKNGVELRIRGEREYVKETVEMVEKRLKKEQNSCSNRLRRWQIYGDVIFE